MAHDFDISNLTPEQLDILRGQLGIPKGTRTPAFKPLRNLNAPNTPEGRIGRPHFEWSTYEPPEGCIIPPFPRLYWNPRGQEVRVESHEHMQQVGVGEGWTDAPPMANAVSPEEQMRAELELLSAEDREFLLKSVKDARMASLKERMVGLSNEDIASLMPAKPKAVEKKQSA